MWRRSIAGGIAQQPPDRRAEHLRVLASPSARRERSCGAGCGRQRRARGSARRARARAARCRCAGGRAVAARVEHPREQLLGGLARARCRAARSLVAGEHQPRLQLEQRGDQHDELGRRLEVELAARLEVVEVGEHDLGERELEQVDLLAQDQRQQQVERPAEDVEVEVERRRAVTASPYAVARPARRPLRRRRGRPDAHRARARRRASPRRSPAPARRRRRGRLEPGLVGAQLARSARAPAPGSRSTAARDGRLEVAVARASANSASTAAGVAPRTAARISIRLRDARLVGRAADLAARVGDRALELPLDRAAARRARTRCPARCRRSSTSCVVGSCRSMIRAPTSGMRCSGTTRTSSPSPKRALKRRATSRISSRCSRWSSPTGHLVGAVGEHVGGLQHRVEEQPGRDQLALGRATCR